MEPTARSGNKFRKINPVGHLDKVLAGNPAPAQAPVLENQESMPWR